MRSINESSPMISDEVAVAGEGNESRKRDPDLDCKIAQKTDNSCLESEH